LNEIAEYNKVVIYYTTGTGNTWKVSRWAEDIAVRSGIPHSISNIEEASPKKDLAGNCNKLLMILTPTHGFTAPWHTIKFAWKMPKVKKTKVFAAATRASFGLGNKVVPGLSGTATFIILLILLIKGYKVVGMDAFDMPSNWFSLHPIQKEKGLNKVIQKTNGKAYRVFDKIISGKTHWLHGNFFYELISGLILFPISYLYLCVGRFFLAKLFFANEKCNNCKICAKNCPVGAIKIYGKKKPRPYWTFSCESCMRCAGMCPENAIEAGHSIAAILIYVGNIPFSYYLINEYAGNLFILDFSGSFIGIIINSALLFPIIYLTYLLIWLLTKVAILNKVFSFTTFTHFWGRYKLPGIKIKDLKR
jgi:Pyruvate/2-oxoacid:ferredoxin oxidoreductase delta subunit